VAATIDIPELEHKAIAASPESGLLAADDETGVVEALVSVTGIPDEVKDIIEPGAYKETLAERTPKGIMAHDWAKWVARTEDIKELMPGDPKLPKQGRDGKPWPAQAGALYVKARFNLDTPEGKAAFSNVKFFSETGECEWSIGYKVPPGKSVRTKDGMRRIRSLALFEYSPVLFGAAPLSGTLTVKALPDGGQVLLDEGVTTDAGDGAGGDDLITREADEDDPEATELHHQAIAGLNAADGGWDAIDAASMIHPGEEDLNDVTADEDGAKSLEFDDDGEVKASGGVSDKPWSDFTPAGYTPEQWHKACLIHMHPPGETPGGKQDCHLPVSEPDGTLNRNGVHAAAGALAGARGGVKAPAPAKAAAARKLRGLYKRIGDDPPASLQAKALALADLASPPPAPGTAAVMAVSSGQWTGSPEDYTLTQWHDSTLVHTHPDGQFPAAKQDCAVPVTLPDGQLDADGMTSAAAQLAGGAAAAAGDREAKAALALLFRRVGVTAPEGLLYKAGGQEATPGDMRAADRLKHWYEHGGGAAQIGWGTGGDFMRCVAIAGKHMDPAKAKGYCQLRHKGATGFYAGHAPGEAAAHAAEGKALFDQRGLFSDPGTEGQADLFDDDGMPGMGGGGYDPALEGGPYAGHAPAPGWPGDDLAWPHGGAMMDMDGDNDAGMPGGYDGDADDGAAESPLEEILDRVAGAVTAALTGPGPGGLPRHLVTVNGTWPGHVIATRVDALNPGDDGESFEIPWQHGDHPADGIRLGEPSPVILTAGGGHGLKSLDDGDGETVDPLPLIVEHVTGIIRRSLQHKEGRVLSNVNVKLLRGAVDQLINVLRNAGIPVGQAGADTNDDGQGSQGNDPLYLPDSTAPAAQVTEGKMFLDPGLVARAYRVTAAAHRADPG
jgi:phage head maturation protease